MPNTKHFQLNCPLADKQPRGACPLSTMHFSDTKNYRVSYIPDISSGACLFASPSKNIIVIHFLTELTKCTWITLQCKHSIPSLSILSSQLDTGMLCLLQTSWGFLDESLWHILKLDPYHYLIFVPHKGLHWSRALRHDAETHTGQHRLYKKLYIFKTNSSPFISAAFPGGLTSYFATQEPATIKLQINPLLISKIY